MGQRLGTGICLALSVPRSTTDTGRDQPWLDRHATEAAGGRFDRYPATILVVLLSGVYCGKSIRRGASREPGPTAATRVLSDGEATQLRWLPRTGRGTGRLD